MGEENKYLVEKHHKAIRSDEVWEKAQEILSQRSRNYNKGTRNGPFRRMYPFSGITFCSFCGSLATRKNWTRKESQKKAWYCSVSIKRGKKYCKHSKPLPEDVIEKCFVDVYRILCSNNDVILKNFIAKASEILNKNDVEVIINKLNIREHDLRQKMKKLVDMKLENIIEEGIYKEKKLSIERKLQKIDEERSGLFEKVDQEKNIKKRVVEFRELLSNKDIMPEFDADVFKILVDKIIIGEVDVDGNYDPYVVSFLLKSDIKEALQPQILEETPHKKIHKEI